MILSADLVAQIKLNHSDRRGGVLVSQFVAHDSQLLLLFVHSLFTFIAIIINEYYYLQQQSIILSIILKHWQHERQQQLRGGIVVTGLALALHSTQSDRPSSSRIQPPRDLFAILSRARSLAISHATQEKLTLWPIIVN